MFILVPHFAIHRFVYFKAAEYKLAFSCRNPFWDENYWIKQGWLPLRQPPLDYMYRFFQN